MKIEAMTKWIEALEDPANEKRQIKDNYRNSAGGVCALGLGFEVFGVRSEWALAEHLGRRPAAHSIDPLMVATGERIVYVDELNDTGVPFWDIAQALRATHLKENT